MKFNLFSFSQSGVTPPPSIVPGLISWGSNNFGQLGLSDIIDRSYPSQVSTTTNWSTIATGAWHSAAIKTDGTLWTWGFNADGELGLGLPSLDYSSPKQVGILTNWLTISAGKYHTAAIKTNGTLWTWGLNGVGQLGLGSTATFLSPVQVGALTTWLSVSCGDYYTLATKTDGTLWSWGHGTQGQLGLNNATFYRSSPVQVGALTNWLKVASGAYHVIAIKTDGTLWSWGFNASGQLGHNNTINRSSPVQIGALVTWVSISAGRFHTAAEKIDGTLWTWGSNLLGQLGLNSVYNISFSSPKQVGSLINWSKVCSGALHSTAIKTDGTLWTWGYNASGQLGIGNLTGYSSPKQVGTLTNWYKVGEVGGQESNSLAINGLPAPTGKLSSFGAPVIIGGQGLGIGMAPDGSSIYASVSGTNFISHLQRNPNTGGLTHISTFSSLAAQPDKATCSPDGLFTYIPCWTGNIISQYNRNLVTGALTVLTPSTTAAGTQPYILIMSHNGSWAYSINTNSNNIYRYNRDAITGLLGAGTATATVGSPSSAAISPDDKFLYVISNNVGDVYRHAISNPGNGALTGSTIYASASTTQVRSIVISSDGTSLYVVGAGTIAPLPSLINHFSRDVATGALTFISSQTLSAGLLNITEMTLTANDSYLYITNITGNNVFCFSRNSGTGALTALTPPTVSMTSPGITVSGPQGVVVSPNSKQLYITVGYSTGAVKQFNIG